MYKYVDSSRPSRCVSRPRAFTLVELLVVVGIIALLVTLLMPTLMRARELTRRTICGTNLYNLGRGWHMYFTAFNHRTPNQFNTMREVSDSISQFCYLIWCGRQGTAVMPDYVNAGALYKAKYVTSESLYVCPTVASKTPGNWFNDDNNPWPVKLWPHTTMTYGTRRMKYYDNPSLAALNHSDTADDDIMIWSSGVQDINNPQDFSWMADRFTSSEIAMQSHVPGIQVLYLDGHADFFMDEEGDVLYDNGITDQGTAFNWHHDDIWMIIDRYHQPPVGQRD